MNTDLKITLISAAAGAASAIIGGGVVALADYMVRSRETDVKMIEIAVGLIRQPPTEVVQPAREWAIRVIEHYSEVPLGDKARAALLKCPLDLSDKFGRIGAAAMEHAPGLPGAEDLPEPPC